MRYYILLLLLSFFISSSQANELIIEPDAGRAPILTPIKQAKSSVALAMYGLTDAQFTQALITAKNQGKTVQVLLEPNPYKASDENTHAIQQLQAEHIDLRWPDKSYKLIHQKTFLFDQQYAIVMTFNLTHSTFTRQRNFALIVTDPAEVQEIVQVFAADWAHKPTVVHNANLVWSPDNSREKILNFIRSAQSNINLYAQDISDYQVIGALAKAASTGVKVNILLSENPEKFHNKKMDYLRKHGVIIHNSHHFVIHAKVIMTDHKRALLGSINFTKPSLDNNRELSVITDDQKVVDQLEKTFDSDWTQLSKKNETTPCTENANEKQVCIHMQNKLNLTRRVKFIISHILARNYIQL